MSRKPLPTPLKVIAGTHRPDREPDHAVPEFEAVSEFPEAPQHLNVDGAQAWKDLGPKLVAAGVLQTVDLYPLEQLCYAWQRFRVKAKAGMDMTAADDAALRSLFSEFGMTPAARRRVAANLVAPDGVAPKKNAFLELGKRPDRPA